MKRGIGIVWQPKKRHARVRRSVKLLGNESKGRGGGHGHHGPLVREAKCHDKGRK